MGIGDNFLSICAHQKAPVVDIGLHKDFNPFNGGHRGFNNN
jgi:hypothetical protein